MHTASPALAPSFSTYQPLQGIHILSLALNLPGPAALMRCRHMGAQCSKLEPIPEPGQASADAMNVYSAPAYAQLHEGITLLQANLKTAQGQQLLHTQLAHSDVLLTSFRPSALQKLGLDWPSLHAQHPQLCMVRIFGDTTPSEANHAGHDLTYQAQAGLIQDGQMPSTLLADMTGAVMASEAVMQCLLLRTQSGHGHCLDIGLAQAAQWLALPRHWRLTTPEGDVGGAHAGYRIYRCADGWVALAALEPHFAARLCQLIGACALADGLPDMRTASVHQQLEAFFIQKTCAEISAVAGQSDIPLQLIHSKYK